MDRRQIRRVAILVLFLPVVSCSSDRPTDAGGGEAYKLIDAFPNLDFSRPVDLQAANDGSNRLFVLEQEGLIRSFDNSATTSTARNFLDIRVRVGLLDYGEKGLLSLAFSPDFPTSGEFYVYYTATKKDTTFESRLSRFTAVPPGANSVDPNTEEIVLSFEQPTQLHNGGQLVFDDQGYLYFSFGDGGSRFQAQDPSDLLGSIVRIDVSTDPYAIPPDNPFVQDASKRPEIFAYGFRNPWRMTIDPTTKLMYVGDVGSGFIEEIDIIEPGGNYGWNCREGSHQRESCTDTLGLTGPIWEYSHNEGSAIVGGYVYRGSQLTTLVGKYVYADYFSGRLWALMYDGAVAHNELLIQNTGLIVSSLGLDGQGGLYMCSYDPASPSKIYKLIETIE